MNAEFAIREYSRAIHLFPTKYLLYLHRGSLLLKQGKMSEATSDFHAAFDLNASIAETFIQRALILSFQRKYQQIIQEFEDRRRQRKVEDPALLIL
jgi:tetratricopeptide (TPR) repeat protein